MVKTRRETKDPFGYMMDKMSRVSIGKTKTYKPKTPKHIKTDDDMLADMFGSLTIGKKFSSKSKRRKGSRFTKKKPSATPKTFSKMDTAGGRKTRRRRGSSRRRRGSRRN